MNLLGVTQLADGRTRVSTLANSGSEVQELVPSHNIATALGKGYTHHPLRRKRVTDHRMSWEQAPSKASKELLNLDQAPWFK